MGKKLLKIFIPAIILLFILVIALIIFKRLKLSNIIKENFVGNERNLDAFNSQPYYILTGTSEFSKMIYIPVITNKENIQFKLDAYDINGPISFTMLTDYQDGYAGEIYPFFVHSLFGKEEFLIPSNAITKIDNNTFEIRLTDFGGYTTFDGKKYLYKLFSKGKIDGVLLLLYRTTQNPVNIDFSLLK